MNNRTLSEIYVQNRKEIEDFSRLLQLDYDEETKSIFRKIINRATAENKELRDKYGFK